MIDDVQQSGLNKLGFHDWRDDFDQRFLRENDCSFGNGIDITCKPKAFQIIKEIFMEKAGASQIVNIFLFKMQVFDVINSLVKTAGNGIGTAARILAIKNIKDNMFFGVSFKVACIMVNSYKSVNKVKFLLFVFISLPLFIHMLHAKPLSGIKESAVQQDAYLFQ